MGTYSHILLALTLVCLVPATGAMRVDLDVATVSAIAGGRPIFSNLYYEPLRFAGDFGKARTALTEFYTRRAEFRAGLEAETEARIKKLADENRRMLGTRGDNGEETGPDSKWGLALYDNIADQAAARQSYLDALADWDIKNWVEVDVTRDGEKQFLTSVRIHRAGETPKAMALSSPAE